MGSIKLVIFDLDGTLVDAYQAVARSLNVALKKTGYPKVNFQEIKRSVGWGDRNLVGKFVEPHDLTKALKIYRRDHKTALKQSVRFLPGAKRVLTRLKKKRFKLAIASNRPTHYTRIILNHLNILESFQFILCADKVKNPKPAADLLNWILKKMNVKPSEAIYIGDMAIDIQTGKKAGVKTIAVATGSSSRKELLALRPLSVVNRLEAVLPLLENMHLN